MDSQEITEPVPGSTEDPLDRNYTPPALAAAIVRWLDEQYGLEGSNVIEPHVGAGAFVKAFLNYPIDYITCVDADPLAPYFVANEFSSLETWVTDRFEAFAAAPVEPDRFDIAAGNPPFSDAEQQIRSAISLLSPTGVLAYILPLHFHGSTGRRDFFREFCPTKIKTIRPRLPCFINGKQEMREMGVWIWEKESLMLGRTTTELSHFDYEPEKKPRKKKARKGKAHEEDRQEEQASNQDHQEDGSSQETTENSAGNSGTEDDRERENQSPEAAQDSEGCLRDETLASPVD